MTCKYRTTIVTPGGTVYLACGQKNHDNFGLLLPPEQCDVCTVAESGATSAPSLPRLPRRILSYAEAVTAWIAAGRPVRTDEEVARLYAEACSPCAPSDRCPYCGCRVAQDGYALTNKLKMATEHCPRGLW
jgi:hypothetical protein